MAFPYVPPDPNTLPNASASYNNISSSGDPSEPLEFPEAAVQKALLITARVYDPNRRRSANVTKILVQCDDRRTPTTNYAYWITKKLSDAIFGSVRLLVVLEKRTPGVKSGEDPSAAGAEWEITSQRLCVKQMSWSRIIRMKETSSCDPLREIAAMQYIMHPPCGSPPHENLMTQLVTLSDNDYLYSIMPYCGGGELFEKVSQDGRFPEPLARHWFRQLLQGLYHLQKLGISHRDMSLENFLLDGDRGLIMDFDLALLIPYNCPYGTSVPADVTSGTIRRLLSPIGRVGKWTYMSPEIASNEDPFDGIAVDLWSAGVMLFLMLAAYPPFEFASPGDPRFRMVSSGRLYVLLDKWGITMSADAQDLLQGMLMARPSERLTLQQVMHHPWVVNGEVISSIGNATGNEGWRN